ncbi:MAG: L-threonylcarbamoyladenylate synthase [Candidatus Nealsonbacteria bacterium]|nr:L-threonylcarbamoyladenylate synthase [Candidatus Nealsonbacteria bacterium]
MKIIKEKSKGTIQEAVKAITKGEVLVLPTDTVYGLIADATSKRAVEKIFKIKNRQKSKSLPVFVQDIAMAKKMAKISNSQEKFLKEVWPGKVTVVLEKRKDCKLPKAVFGGKNTIGFRLPDYKLINVLLEKINKPLIGTSANISGKGDFIEIKKIINQFKNKKYRPDIIVDAGNLKKSKISTVIDFSKRMPEILRIGQVSKDKISKKYNKKIK